MPVGATREKSHFYLNRYFCYTVPTTEQLGWRSGESTCLPPMWRRFYSRSQRHIWVDFVVGFSPGTQGSPRLLKNQHFQIPIPSGLLTSTLLRTFGLEDCLSTPHTIEIKFLYFTLLRFKNPHITL